MRRVTPKVFLIGETQGASGLRDYLMHIGAEWEPVGAPSWSEHIMEFMGRLCYRSFKPGMNANVTKVREGNAAYLANIVKVKHGSVLEHCVTNWVFADVSRVFTHELVRHRAGTAFSQESLRFVRLTDLGLWLPPEADNDDFIRRTFERTYETLEDLQKTLAEYLHLDDEKMDFKNKKILTSMMRRVAPEGLATTIGVSFNFRALRFVIEQRTELGAEAEIRLVFDEVAKIAKERWPNVFADFTRDSDGQWVTGSRKV